MCQPQQGKPGAGGRALSDARPPPVRVRRRSAMDKGPGAARSAGRASAHFRRCAWRISASCGDAPVTLASNGYDVMPTPFSTRCT